MKNSEKNTHLQKKIRVILILSNNPKSTIVLYKNENFPKIAGFQKNHLKNATY